MSIVKKKIVKKNWREGERAELEAEGLGLVGQADFLAGRK
jgi:hypothetical protein